MNELLNGAIVFGYGYLLGTIVFGFVKTVITHESRKHEETELGFEIEELVEELKRITSGVELLQIHAAQEEDEEDVIDSEVVSVVKIKSREAHRRAAKRLAGASVVKIAVKEEDTLEELKAIAKELKIKGYHLYKDTENLKNRIDEEYKK